MTISELSQLYWLNREIEADQKRLEEIKSKIYSLSSPSLDKVPSYSTNRTSVLENGVAEIIDLQAIISAKKQQCIHEQNRLERYISGIPDSLTRLVFIYRFINGLTWNQVAQHIGNNTESSVKKICYRYLKTQRDIELR